jgi:hypothetical protein
LTSHAQWTEREWCRRISDFLKLYSDQVGHVYADEERLAFDGTRVDILTDKVAFEVDRTAKWAEAIGQAIYYGMQHKRQPGIILLSEDYSQDANFIYRCQLVCGHVDILIWLVNVKQASLYIFGDQFDLSPTVEIAATENRRSLKGL